jgi:hypothetical protein
VFPEACQIAQIAGQLQLELVHPTERLEVMTLHARDDHRLIALVEHLPGQRQFHHKGTGLTGRPSVLAARPVAKPNYLIAAAPFLASIRAMHEWLYLPFPRFIRVVFD